MFVWNFQSQQKITRTFVCISFFILALNGCLPKSESSDSAKTSGATTQPGGTAQIQTSNHAPSANSVEFSFSEDTLLSASLTATDLDDDKLAYALQTAPLHGKVELKDTKTGKFLYTPIADYNGTDNFTFIANDGQADSKPATIKLTVKNVNDAPLTQSVTLAAGETYSGVLPASDPDGDALTFSIVTSPSLGTLLLTNNKTGAYTYTAGATATGTDSFTFKVSDGTTTSSTSIVNLNISLSLLKLSGDGNFGTRFAGTSTDSIFTLKNESASNATSITAGTTSFTTAFKFKGGTYPGTGGTCGSALAPVTSCTIVLVFTPTSAASYTNAFQVSYFTGSSSKTALTNLSGAGLLQASLSVSDGGSNSFGDAIAVSAYKDQSFTVTNNGDSDATLITPSSIVGPISFPTGNFPGMSSGGCSTTLAAHATCFIKLRFSPTASGLAYGTLQLSFFAGTASGSQTTTFSGTGAAPASLAFDLAIYDFGSVPIGNTVSQTVTLENSGDVSTTISMSGSLLAPFSFKGGSYPGTGGTCLTALAGIASCSLVLNFAPTTLSAQMNITVSYTSAAVAKTSSAVIKGMGNKLPIAASQSITTNEDTAKSIVLAGSDGDGDPLTYAIATPPVHGTVSGTLPNIIYTPTPHYSGGDSFTFTVNDSKANSVPGTISVTITHVNHAPVSAAQSVSTNQNAAVSFVLSASDPDQDNLVFSYTAAPAHGTLTGMAPNLTYTPAANYFGADSFKYKASDGVLTTAEATVSITVNKINQPPAAYNISMKASRGSSTKVPVNVTDPENATLTLEAVAPPPHGTISPDTTKTILFYTPVNDYTGTDTFTYRAYDGNSYSNTATVSVTVYNNHAPYVARIQRSVSARSKDEPYNFTISALDIDNDPLTFRITRQPTGGKITGTFPNLTFTPSQDGLTYFNFSYVVNDGISDSEEAGANIIFGSENKKLVVTGQGAACSINDYTPFCRGTNMYGVLGNGTTQASLTPTSILGVSSIYNQVGVPITNILSLTWGHGCLIRSGFISCWGYNTGGQLGIGSTVDTYQPTLIKTLTTGGATGVSVNGNISCAIVNGGAHCWGNGYLGTGVTQMVQLTSPSPYPIQFQGASVGVTAISVGSVICAIVNGGLQCWGNNWAGQLGNGTQLNAYAPMPVPGFSSGVTSISTSIGHTCAIKNGGAWCWGRNISGELGIGSLVDSYVPAQVTGLSSGVASISAGDEHTCAVLTSGAIKCWGANYYGQIGDGSTALRTTPVLVQGIASGGTQVSVGTAFTCAIVNQSEKCWGYNAQGQLGNNSTTNSTIPITALSMGPNCSKFDYDTNWALYNVKKGSTSCGELVMQIHQTPYETFQNTGSLYFSNVSGYNCNGSTYGSFSNPYFKFTADGTLYSNNDSTFSNPVGKITSNSLSIDYTSQGVRIQFKFTPNGQNYSFTQTDSFFNYTTNTFETSTMTADAFPLVDY